MNNNISEKIQFILDNPPTLMDIYHQENILGEGFNALVLEVDEHWVIRASMVERDGWRAMTRVGERTRAKLSLPRILKTWTDAESFNNNIIELSLVERLEKLEFGVDYSWGSKTLECLNGYGKTPNVDDHIDPTEPCYAVIKQAVRAYKALTRMGVLTAGSLDLNYGNIMKRKNGEYVLTDPFGTQQAKGETE